MRRASAAAIAVGTGSGGAPSERPGTGGGCGGSAAGEGAVAASDGVEVAATTEFRRASASIGATAKQGDGLERLDGRSMRRVVHGQKRAGGDVAEAWQRFGRQQGLRSIFGGRDCGAVRRDRVRAEHERREGDPLRQNQAMQRFDCGGARFVLPAAEGVTLSVL